jgi:GntR family transcriptional regulator
VNVLDPTSDRPLFRQLADHLRQLIATGELKPGDKLPGVPRLEKDFATSTTTAKLALEQLRHEGLVVSEPGRGTFVRARDQVRRVSSERYGEQLAASARGETPQTSAFARDHGVSFDQVRMNNEFHEEPADNEVAGLLEVPVGTALLRRFMILAVSDERAEQVRTEWYPLDLVRHTPMADPSRQPWPGGVIAELVALGLVPTASDEDIKARMPSPAEARLLRLPPGTPVLLVRSVAIVGVQPVAIIDRVHPASRVVLHYRLEL